METVDQEFLDGALKFIEKAHADGKPFFVWWNSTRMHVFTHLKKESQGKTGLGLYPDGMVEHDGHVGKLLDKLDELGIAESTVVMYSRPITVRKFARGRMVVRRRSAARKTRTTREVGVYHALFAGRAS